MTISRDRPYTDFNFLVDLGTGQTDGPDAGFQEISEIGMKVPVIEYRTGNTKENSVIKLTGLNQAHDVRLSRGIIGSLTLYDRLDDIRNGNQNALRTVTIQLLGPDLQTVVLTWTFHQVRPVALSYSPLRAQENEVIIETLELAFDSFEMS